MSVLMAHITVNKCVSIPKDHLCVIVGWDLSQKILLTAEVHVLCVCVFTVYTCSALFGNLRNFEIALRILSIAKLRANFEIADAISKLCNETTVQFKAGIHQATCCYNSATMLQATNHIVWHRRYLLHATTFVACNMLPRIDQLSIPRNFVATKHQRRAACCTQQ